MSQNGPRRSLGSAQGRRFESFQAHQKSTNSLFHLVVILYDQLASKAFRAIRASSFSVSYVVSVRLWGSTPPASKIIKYDSYLVV